MLLGIFADFCGHVRAHSFSILKFPTCNADFPPGHWNLCHCSCRKAQPDLLQAIYYLSKHSAMLKRLRAEDKKLNPRRVFAILLSQSSQLILSAIVVDILCKSEHKRCQWKEKCSRFLFSWNCDVHNFPHPWVVHTLSTHLSKAMDGTSIFSFGRAHLQFRGNKCFLSIFCSCSNS